MASGVPEPTAEFASYLEGRPPAVASLLSRLRHLIHEAAGHAEVGPLAESMKWGEPSWTPRKTGIGSSIRLAAGDGHVAVNFICHTGLVDRFREIYPATFDYGGSRSILVRPGSSFDEAALSHCMALALAYHWDRRRG
ncbi:MAG: DUF1801 domain-containing protein [Rhizobiaceae bacterium]|nr:DUF1801 domain-containing protein [Rhizobiaceae bacterium]MCV0406138.1 DUF1801 domain-containing protein [Rhizobiaceae bacterium]